MADPGNLDRYRYVRTLGSGGMGTVSLATDTVLGRQVALKRVTGSARGNDMLRLRREALVGASVSHPSLVSIYDVEENEEGELVIVMEYVEGETLRDAIGRAGSLGPEEALRILDGAAAGLDAIHAQGIVHRDVKPANILLGRDGSVKVADLGIAAVPDRTRITSSGAVLGSLSYMAPEQLGDAAATPAIDIYALGAVAYEVLSGQRARREPHPVALAYAMDTKPPPDLREAWPAAPTAAAEVLRRTMDRDPRQRPGSASEFVARLRAALDPTASSGPPARAPAAPPVPLRPASEPSRRQPPPPTRPAAEIVRGRSRLLPGALLAVIAAVAVVAVVLATSGGGPRSAPPTAGRHRPGGAGSASASGSTTTSASLAAAAGAPGAAARSFYTLAATHHYPQAWALADPSFQAQLGGYQSFQNTFAADRSITVNSLRTLSRSNTAASVAIQTTSVRTDGTQSCSGTVQLSAGSGATPWRVHQIQISCS